MELDGLRMVGQLHASGTYDGRRWLVMDKTPGLKEQVAQSTLNGLYCS